MWISTETKISTSTWNAAVKLVLFTLGDQI